MKNHRALLIAVVIGVGESRALVAAPELKLLLPLERRTYQTNERIDLSVVRSGAEALPAGELAMTVAGEDGSKLALMWPVAAVAVEGGAARATEHLHLNGALLRPGRYAIAIAADGASVQTNIEVFSHIRRSSFKLIDWASRAKDAEQTVLGEDSMGFNLFYAAYGGLNADALIRGGLDFMWCCTMSGGHQMDLRMECDWSDPYVLQGAEARVVREALKDRTKPNCLGVHFYDEPGLTWWKHAQTGAMAPYNIPAQDRSFQSAYGVAPLQYNEVKPDNADAVARWTQMNRWKLSFMDAAWKYASFGVSHVRPDFLSVTQSQYGWSAYADGYYFNVARSLPVISGHGGYDDYGPGYFNPGWFFEMGRVRDFQKPVWYLPGWYGNEPSDRFRLEQYLSFMMNLQGMAKPPDMQIHNPAATPAADGIVESNKLMARLGTIFTTMPVTRPPVAMLWSLSQNLAAEIKDMQNAADLNKSAYEGGGHNRDKLCLVYLAGKMIHIPIMPIVEEDVQDGTLAAHHKVLIVPGVNYLEPKVIAAMEQFIAGGGTVLVTDDSQVQIKGATKLGVAADNSFFERLGQLWRDKKEDERRKLDITGNFLKAAEPVAKALATKLRALGITQPLDADAPGIVTSREAHGDMEYLFAVNATFDSSNAKDRNSIKPAAATLTMTNDGRPVYDAVHGGAVAEFKPHGKELKALFRFGPGQMRVFARTARPIGGVQVSTPALFNDYTVASAPVRVEFAATVVDNQQRALAGAVPLRIRVVDPLGVTRHDLYRSERQISLPLAANDPSGEWKIIVRELLANTESAASFTFQPLKQCGALAGATHRAVGFGNDRENIFRFFRVHRDVTIVKGSSEYNTAAANRLVEILKPWDTRCTIVNAADVNKPRALTPLEAATWAGLDSGTRKPEEANVGNVGFAVRGPVILLGSPEDNPLIKFALEKNFLPYKTDATNFPGRGRGFMAWQRDAVSYQAESITLLAYDAAGMSEAVGSLYETQAGLDPLTPLTLPATAAVAAASKAVGLLPEAVVDWSLQLPDRAVAMAATPQGEVIVSTADGSITTVAANGKVVAKKIGAVGWPAPVKVSDANLPPLPGHIIKHIAKDKDGTAVAYWGGTLQILDAGGTVKSSQQFADDFTDIVWLNGKLIVGLSDGTLLSLRTH